MARRTFYDVCRLYGLLDNLQYVIDATDIRSFPGQSQVLNDITGQAAAAFVLGTSSGDASADPTFVQFGRRNRKRAYFSLPDFSPRITSPLSAWSQGLHKDNVRWSWAAWRKVNASDPTHGHGLVSTLDPSTLGFQIGLGPTAALDKLLISQGNGGGGGVNVIGPAVTSTFGAWSFYAISYDEPTGAAIFQVNGTQTTATQAYVGPSASNPSTNLLSVYDNGDGGSAIRADAMWGRALAAAELSTLYTQSLPYFAAN